MTNARTIGEEAVETVAQKKPIMITVNGDTFPVEVSARCEVYALEAMNDAGDAHAKAMTNQCSTPQGRKEFYAGDGVARATVMRDQALALAARFSSFIRA